MKNLTGYLQGLELFEPLPEDMIRELARKFTTRSLEVGDVLFRQGQPSDALYIVTEGLIRIVIAGDEGEEVVNETGPGVALGQMTLIDMEPRTAGAVAAEFTILLVLSRDDFMEAFNRLPVQNQIQLREISRDLRLNYADILRQVPLFHDLPDEALKVLMNRIGRKRLERDEVLFNRGDVGDALYVIDKGWVKVIMHNAEGEELTLNQLGPGEVLGEMSLVDEVPRAAGVVALTETEVLWLTRDAFIEFLNEYPAIAQIMLRMLSQRLRFSISYIQQAIELSRKVAEGDYSFAKTEIEKSQSQIIGRGQSDESRVREMLAAFFSMVEGVQKREEELKAQVRMLSIQIDEVKRQEEVESLTGSDFFAELKASAKRIREQDDED
nr:cyclic nucleotide-binding domain-containing protein [Anaerolineae bacterium]